MDRDFTVVGIYSFACVHKDLDDELVTQILDAVFSNVDQLLAITPAAKDTKIENIVHMVTPLHPAAIKWYEAKGVKIPSELYPPEYKK